MTSTSLMKTTMEDQLIVAVCRHPVLYDTSLYSYRDRTKKEVAWRAVAEEVGLTADVCRKKWKGLRDTFLKEKKRESEAKRSGAAAGTYRRWKYSAVLSFLDPHVTPRATASNMERGVGEDRTAEEPGSQAEQDPSQAEDWAELSVAGHSGGGDYHHHQQQEDLGSPSASEETEVDPHPPVLHPIPPRGRKASQKRSRDNESTIERMLMQSLGRENTPAPPPLSEDEIFFKSLLPAMQRLPLQQKEHVKFNIYKLIYEASTIILNLETVEGANLV